MSPDRRRQNLLLAALAVTVAGAVAYELWPVPETAGGVPRAAVRGTAAKAAAPTTTLTAPNVHLQALRAGTPPPETPLARDLFRFKEKAPPPMRREPAATAPPITSPPPPPPPSGPPPIQMRFIGLVEATQQAQKIAILSDGRGVYQGREGDIIEGRYRILRIGVESVDMAYVDGRGRQTIRLSGS
jgi:hypothetical protein